MKRLRSALPDAKVVVVVGPGFENVAEIELVRDANTELLFRPDARGMASAMASSCG